MTPKNNKELLALSGRELYNLIPEEKVNSIQKFIHEMNRREFLVRFDKSISFDEFKHESDEDFFGTGFIVEGRSVPYFHPNRSFHDEIIWLNENVFYNDDCSFADKLINAAIVKFYGPSNTISLITSDTGRDHIVYDSLVNDEEYVLKLMKNIENASRRGQKIYGTTELRTSLQTESRNYTRNIVTPYDKLIGESAQPTRQSRVSDMLYWFTMLGPLFKDFYSKRPTMEESFDFLTSFRGIGNYYGYHFSTNLARMPEVGTKDLLRPGSIEGNLSENDDFVAPGVGAMITVNWFYENLGFSVNSIVGAKLIRWIRDNQDEFFDFTGVNKKILNTVSETGQFTTFGCEISCCQFGVFLRLRESKKMALNRSNAPISKESIGETCEADGTPIVAEDYTTTNLF